MDRWGIPLGGEMDDPMVDLEFDEMDDDDDVLEDDVKWLMAPVTPSRDTVTVLSTYENQQLRTRVAEMESREGAMMSYMLRMEERLTVLEKRLSGLPLRP
nr:hypothetical protein [Tanacetum cinerariifolium]